MGNERCALHGVPSVRDPFDHDKNSRVTPSKIQDASLMPALTIFVTQNAASGANVLQSRSMRY